MQTELLNDFFTECDEHVTNIRQALIQLEPSIGKAQADAAIVEDLFHSFHSLKGISAIVGLREAEDLAHGTEDYLRELITGSVSLTAEGLKLLMAAAQRLEQVVMAFRSRQALPAHQALVESLRAISGKITTSSAAQETPASGRSLRNSPLPLTVEAAQGRGMVLWKFTFTPSRDLDERGVNLNSVRARLSAGGEILQSTSRVRGKGEVAFEFLVGMKEAPPDLAAWEQDGLAAELLEQHGPSDTGPTVATEGSFTPEENPFIAPTHVVRVDLQRLDELMRIVGEMVIQRSRFEDTLVQTARQGEGLDRRVLQEVNAGLGRSLRALREAIMRVRLVSVAEIFARMPFVVRDLARESRNKARLTLEGQQTEIDKYLIEQLKDPLLHLVRNAFSHGVELPEERIAAGKPEEAEIILKASTSGDSVLLSIEDDGRGIDEKAVAKRAVELGWPTPQAGNQGELLKMLCAPGFSTRDDADRAAGRGVGMAVVYAKVRELGGTLTLESTAYQGTKFMIRLPLTLAIADALIVSAAGQRCAVPQNSVSEVLQITDDAIRKVNGVEAIPYRDGVLPILRLASIFRLPRQTQPRMCVLVLTSDRGSSGLLVDTIHGQKEVVVRAIRDPLLQVPGVIGATELGDGRPVLILDAAMFTSGAVRPNGATLSLEAHGNRI